MSTSTIVSEEGSASSGMRADESSCSLAPDLSAAPISSHYTHPPELKPKKRRNKPGNPDPEAEVVALSPRSLTCTAKYSCEICGKGFQREQNLQLHRRGHNLPWTLKHGGGGGTSRKKVYICPEESCAHHHPSRALGDLTGIKKHFLRKHGEKRWACERCSKKYALLSDCRAHARACGTREYRCNCGAIFSRKDSFATHRAFCDALAEESSRIMAAAAVATPAAATNGPGNNHGAPPVEQQQPPPHQLLFSWQHPKNPNPYPAVYTSLFEPKVEDQLLRHGFVVPGTDPISGVVPPVGQHHLPCAAVLQGAVTASHHPLSRTSISISCTTTFVSGNMVGDGGDLPARQRAHRPLTRDFLGMAGEGEDGLLSFSNVSTCCCSGGHATEGITDAARPPPAAGDTSVSQAWRY